MAKSILIFTIAFIVGAIAIGAPFLIIGHVAHIDEAAREEETMGPGIATAFGLLAAPFGGIAAALLAITLRRRKLRRGRTQAETDKHPLPT